MTTQTDGHWPLGTMLGNFRVIGCECGAKPKKPSATISTQHTWHQSHRRSLKLQPVEYEWALDDNYLVGLSTGGYVRVRDHEWRNGQWVRTMTNTRLQAAFLAAKAHGKILNHEVLADIIRAAEETK